MKKNYSISSFTTEKYLSNKSAVYAAACGFQHYLLAVFCLLFPLITFAQETAYCIPAPLTISGDGITNVAIGSINNTTVAEPGNYADYSAQIVNTGQSVAQSFSISLATSSPFSVKVWVDWNDNFSFDDAGDEVFSATSASGITATVNGIFTVPASAALGYHRLRVGATLVGRGGPPATPCYTGFNGAFEDYTINVTVPPTCFVPTGLAVTNVRAGVVNINWTAPLPGNTPQGYQYLIDANVASPTSGTPVTGTFVNNVTAPVNGYLHVRANCGETDFSEWVTIPFYNGYCIPAPQYVDGTGITNVAIGTINNTTSDAVTYNDFTSQVANIGQGVTQPFSINLATNNAYNTKVWIDWNNDLDFDDAGEEVYDYTTGIIDAITLNGTFTIPVSATLGQHRLRVGTVITWSAPVIACYNGPNAAFEDYTINVTTPPGCFTPTNPLGTSTAAGIANISWTAPTFGSNPAGYEYAVTTLATPPLTGTATTATSALNVTVTPYTLNYIHVRTNCGGGSFSNWFTAPYYNGYCIPAPTSLDGGGITNVTIANVNNTTENEDRNYGNYTDEIINIGQGVTQPFSITLNTFSPYNLKIWVDLNNDLDFDDAGEEIYSGVSANSETSTVTGYITLPITASLGNHRLRVGAVVNWSPITACYTGEYGTFEDYTLNVTTPPSCFTPTNFTAQMVGAGLNNLSWTAPLYGTPPAGYEYAVTVTNATPDNGTDVTGTSITNVSVPLNATSYFHIRTNCGNGDFSEWVTLPFYNGVCIPTPRFVNGAGITNVKIGSINNATLGEPGYYGDFTNQIVNIGQGVTQPFSLNLNVFLPYNVKIWVDWNDDLAFDGAGEEVYAGISGDAEFTVLRGAFTTPVGAVLGNHRLRIGITPNYNPQPLPCGEVANGTYEDYMVNVTLPPTCYMPTNPIGVGVAPGLANLSWTAPSLGGTPTGYEYVVDTNNTINPASGTATTGTTVNNYTGLTDNTIYYLHVRTNCGDNDFSDWITSDGFRYFAGDNCESAIDLGAQPSPYTHTTVGAFNDYTSACAANNNAPDLYYYIDVPNGYTVVIEQTSEDYDSTHYAGYGGACPGQTPLACTDDEFTTTTWENISGRTERVYWVQDGFASTSGTFTLEWSLIPPASCDIPRGLDANVTSLTSAVVSWYVPNTGTPVGYEYAVTASDAPPSAGSYTITRSATVNTLIPNTSSYLHVRTICSEENGNSEWVTYAFFSGYCVPTNTESTEYYITGVSTTGGETNFTSVSPDFSAFTNYTSQHSVTSYAGGTFNIQATAPNAIDDYLYTVWIDWNNNYDFTDDNERVINTQYLTSPASLGTVTVPTGVATGSYRMRIRNAHIGSPVPACGEQGSGEAEDYTVNIVAAPTCFPPFGLAVNATDVTTANLTWSPPFLGSAPSGYEYVFGSSSAEPTGTGIATTERFIENVTYDPTLSVYLFVRSTCGEGEYSDWVSTAILATDAHIALNNVFVYKEGSAINITSGNVPLTGVSVYDIRGRILYSQTDINAAKIAITGLEIQQQVLIVEVNTDKGKVSKRIVF